MVVRLWIFLFLLSPYLHVFSENEQSENGWYQFFYLPYTNNFYVVEYKQNQVDCYVATLTSNELLAVHTDAGLRAIEVKMLSLIGHAIPVKSQQLNSRDAVACSHANNHNRTLFFFKLN